ncbi:MAG: DinB family protein [Flavobacterium sp.]|nr:DinB family protein [Flavobacterium sp.]
MLIQSIRKNFIEITSLLDQLNNEIYTYSHKELNASIGEHIRHIIELYQSLMNNYEIGVVNYDKRNRNIQIQTSIQEAKNAINNIMKSLDLPNKKLMLEQGNLTTLFSIETNYYRELLYNLEHSIHHQALIKVALIKYPNIQLPENFGIAKSTIEYKKQCVQ